MPQEAGGRCTKVGMSEFSLQFLQKTPIVHFVVGVSTETYNFKLKVSSLVFRPGTKLQTLPRAKTEL